MNMCIKFDISIWIFALRKLFFDMPKKINRDCFHSGIHIRRVRIKMRPIKISFLPFLHEMAIN